MLLSVTNVSKLKELDSLKLTMKNGRKKNNILLIDFRKK